MTFIVVYKALEKIGSFAKIYRMKTIINTNNAPAPIGPYSQAVRAGNMLFVSGQIAIVPATGELDLSTIENETHQVMKNIGAILKEAGADYSDIIKTGIFLKDMNQFAAVNTVYGSYFSSDFPARETVQVSRLPKDVNVEISVVVFLK
jgi:2-iminobutanoate/2-iminopropanoate deaminase